MDAEPKSEAENAAAFDQEEYTALRTHYFDPVVQHNVELPGGRTLRKTTSPPRIEQKGRGYDALRKKIAELDKQNDVVAVWHLLRQLRAWETRPPSLGGAALTGSTDAEVTETIDLTKEENALDVDEFINDVLLTKVVIVKPDPDGGEVQVSLPAPQPFPKRVKAEPGTQASFEDRKLDVLAEKVASCLEPDALVRLIMTSKLMRARLTGAARAVTTKVFLDAYGAALPVDADPLVWPPRLHRWTRYERVTDELDPEVAKAFVCGTLSKGLTDQEFFSDRHFRSEADKSAFLDRAKSLAAAATWLSCAKRLAFRDESVEDDIVYVDEHIGDTSQWSRRDDRYFYRYFGDVEQSLKTRVRFAEHATVELSVSMQYGKDHASSVAWSLRVEISGERSSDAEFGEELWCGEVGYGDANDGPPVRNVSDSVARRLSAALGLTGDPESLMGFLVYALALPYRFEFAPAAVGVNGDSEAGECGSMLLVVRRHVLLLRSDEKDWDDMQEVLGSVPPPPVGLQYHYNAIGRNEEGFGWWLGKTPRPKPAPRSRKYLGPKYQRKYLHPTTFQEELWPFYRSSKESIRYESSDSDSDTALE